MKRIWKILASVSAATVLSACGGGDGDAGGGTSTQVAGTNVALAINSATGAVLTQTFTGDPLTFAAGINAGGLVIPGPATMTITDSGGGTQSFAISGAGGVTAAGAMSYGSCIFKIASSFPGGPVVGTTYTISACGLEVATSGTKVGEAASVDTVLNLGGSKSSPKKKSLLIRIDGTVAIVIGTRVIELPGIKLTVQTFTGTGSS
jgi:hypothetical protein